MSNQRPRIVLVGAGGYGRLYVETMAQRDYGADLAAICDIDPHLADRIPIIREQSIPIYPSLEAFFANDTADLAVLVSPVHFHTDMVLLCLAHGLNVLCEKPLCLTTQEAETMRTAAQKAGRFLSIGYQIDYRRDVLALKQDILAGRSTTVSAAAQTTTPATTGPGTSPAMGAKFLTAPLPTPAPTISRC